jgi:hypothetical protein
VPVGIDPGYPAYAGLFGRSSGGKTLFTRIAARLARLRGFALLKVQFPPAGSR